MKGGAIDYDDIITLVNAADHYLYREMMKCVIRGVVLTSFGYGYWIFVNSLIFLLQMFLCLSVSQYVGI